LDADDQPCSILDAGVRTFEAGVEASYDEMLQGKQQSKAANRRSKRGPRRQFWRRAWRRYKILKCLVSGGLLRDAEGPNPDEFDLHDPADQDRFLKGVDELLRKRLRPAKGDSRRHLWEQIWPYELRASALERGLDPLELGRAFYHLAQRRGFLSNRKTDTTDDNDPPKKRKKKTKADNAPSDADADDRTATADAKEAKEDTKKVKETITRLGQEMEKTIPDPRFRTLGFYFARHVNPEEQRIRGPGRWTGRLEMYEPEFKAICDAQAAYYPELAEGGSFRKELHDAIFYQRPLKPSGHLVGHCDLEPGRKRAIQALPIAQRFRLLQKVNDLKVRAPDGTAELPLDAGQREKLIKTLTDEGDRTFKQIRKLLDFIEPKISKETKAVEVSGHVFNLERGGEDRIPGDRTAARIHACDKTAPGIKQRWTDMSERLKGELVVALVDYERADALVEHVQERFGFTAEQAAALSKTRLEESRCAFSFRALHGLDKGPNTIKGLVSRMNDGTSLETARRAYLDDRAKLWESRHPAQQFPRPQAFDLLPRVLATDWKHVPPTDKHGRGRRRRGKRKPLEPRPEIVRIAAPAFKNARDLRNPAVTRALAELRKVLNALIRRYGKPARIHVELAREMKKTPLQREVVWTNNRLRQEDRKAAKSAIRMCQEIGISEPTDDDAVKWLLAEECNWQCPYTGKTITARTLYSSPQFQIEHIIPRSVSLDNTFENLTLCDVDYNERIKRKQTPFQAAGNTSSWPEILARVKRFKNRRRAVKNPNRKAKKRVTVEERANPKAERFAWTPEQVKKFYDDEFTPRQLTDTQYAARLAMQYLGMLYGGETDRRGVTDERGVRRVQPSSGGVTAILREEWGLNAVIPGLPDSPAHKEPVNIRLDEKLRTDHRHHAIDAIVIACTGPKTVQLLSDAARRVELAELRREDLRDGQGRRRKRFDVLNPPWGTQQSFSGAVKAVVGGLNVSRRPERKIQGPLHAETNYSKEIKLDAVACRRQRVPLTALSEKDILADNVIADTRVKQAIRAKWEQLGRGKPKDAFKSEASHPRMLPSRKRPNAPPGPPIHTVRINVPDRPLPVGHGSSRRFVLPGKNTIHHAVIVEGQTRQGPRWRVETVSRLDVQRRRRRGLPVIQKDWHPDQLRMWLCKDDCIEMDDGAGTRRVFIVKMISKSGSATDIKVRLHHDARTDDHINQAGERAKFRIRSADTLRQRDARKVLVTPLGEIVYEDKQHRNAND